MPPEPPVRHLSHSSVSAYGECARAWQGRYLEKLPERITPALIVGNVFDEVLERALLAAVAGERVDPLGAWDEAWQRAVGDGDRRRFRRSDRKTGESAYAPIDWQGKLPESVENEGHRLAGFTGTRDLLGRLRPLVEPGRGPALQRAVTLRVPGVPVPIIGYLDIVTDDGVPGDFKTAARPWATTRARKEIQPRLYLAALQQEGFPLRSLTFKHWVWSKGQTTQLQELETVYTPADLFAAVRVVQEAWKGIAAGVFMPNPRAWQCGEGCAVWQSGLCLGAA